MNWLCTTLVHIFRNNWPIECNPQLELTQLPNQSFFLCKSKSELLHKSRLFDLLISEQLEINEDRKFLSGATQSVFPTFYLFFWTLTYQISVYAIISNLLYFFPLLGKFAAKALKNREGLAIIAWELTPNLGLKSSSGHWVSSTSGVKLNLRLRGCHGTFPDLWFVFWISIWKNAEIRSRQY